MSVDQDNIVVDIQDRDDPTKFNAIDKWQHYEINNTAGGGAGTFQFTPTATKDAKALFTSGGQIIRIKCNDALQLTGVTDDRKTGATPQSGQSITVSGRDMAGILVDNAAPRTSLNNMTLFNLADTLIQPWSPTYIQGVIVDSGPEFYKMAASRKGGSRIVYLKGGQARMKTWTAQKAMGGKSSPYYRGIDVDRLRQTRIRAGERIWSVLEKFAKQVACFMYVTADAWLFIGRPTYNRFHYQKLVYGGPKTNVLNAMLDVNIADRFSEYVFTAQGRQLNTSKGNGVNHKVSIRDPGPAFYKLNADGTLSTRFYKTTVIEVKRGCKDGKLLRRLARSTVEQNAVNSYKYTMEIAGHEADTGLLWTPDSCVEVEDNVNEVYGSHWIRSRRFRKGNDGSSTVLELIPADIWMSLDHDTVSDTEWDEAYRMLITW